MTDLVMRLEAGTLEVAELLKALSKKKPDPQAIAAFKKLLDAHPQAWEAAGNLTRMVQDNLLGKLLGDGDRAITLSVKKGLEVKRAELGYSSAPPLERLLIDHVVTCWLHLQDVELRHIQEHGGALSFKEGDYWERRLSATQARYLRACETLARVRRLLRQPPVIVNIAAEGGQQVNIAGDLVRQDASKAELPRS